MNHRIDKILQSKRYHFWMFFALLVFMSLLMMFFYQPLCPGQDFFFHYRRLQALMDNLDSPFLIYLDYSAIDGYGYFTKAFYPDFVLIPFAWLGNLTNIEFAYQFMIFTTTVLCGLFTYIFVNKVYKKPFAAAIGALLFTFCLYKLLDIYHRAALGEAISFTFIPLVFWGLYEIIKGDHRKWYIIAIGFSLMIFTHLISTVLLFITVLIFLVVYYKPLVKEPKRVLSLMIAGIVTLLITSYYLFPMLEQMSSDIFYYESRHLMSKASDAGMELHWLIWGLFSGIVATQQAFVPGIGILLTCVVLLRLFIKGKSSELKSLDIALLIGIVYIFAASAFFPWSVFPFSKLNFIQMGWRLFEFTSFFFTIAGGYYLSLLLKTNKRKLFCGFIICLSIIFVFFNDSRSYEMYRCGRVITQEAAFVNDYHLGGLEYVPDKVPSIEYIHHRGDKIGYDYHLNETVITNLQKQKGITTFNIQTSQKDIFELPLIHYKGYKAELNGTDIETSQSENGLVQIPVESSGTVKVYYAGTVIQKVSFCLSLAAMLSLCIYTLIYSRKRKAEKSI